MAETNSFSRDAKKNLMRVYIINFINEIFHGSVPPNQLEPLIKKIDDLYFLEQDQKNEHS